MIIENNENIKTHHIHFKHKGIFYLLIDDMKEIKTLNKIIKTLIKFKKELK